MNIKTTRRAFLQGATAASAAMVVGLNAKGSWAAAHGGEFMPNPFVKIAPDGKVTVVLKHFEMGQGTSTGLSTLLAEELDANWDDVDIEFAPADTATYMNTLMGVQGSGGSTAIANSYMQYREAGAAAKSLLVQAAAAEWGVDAGEIEVKDGMVSHGSNSASFGDLVGLVPEGATPNPQLKDPSAFTKIGADKLPRKDSNAKTTGTATFAMDVMPEGVVFAVLQRSPKFGGTLTSFDASAAMEVEGVVDVKQIPMGVVVYATNTWAAMKGREALTTDAEGPKVIVASSECMLNRQRRERPEKAKAIAEGRRVSRPKFGVDEDVCTGDHACMRLSGCPSLTLKKLDDPLRDDPVASIDESCVGCGNCGEVADAAVLCPSFYEAEVIDNPHRWEAWRDRTTRKIIGWLQARRASRRLMVEEVAA